VERHSSAGPFAPMRVPARATLGGVSSPPLSADATTFALRTASADDLAAVRTLAREVWWAHYPGIISPAQIEYMLERGYATEALAHFVTGSDAGLELAEAGGTLVGFAAWYDVDERATKLDKIYIHPRWQRHGVGGALIARIAALARKAGRRTLVLNVNKHNVQAQAAYRKRGFALREAVEVDIGGGFVMDDFVMALPLQ
jgi:ribosomal protein S18 acetylase RimI-like enzyme